MRILQQYRLLLLTIFVVSLTSGIQSQVVVTEGTTIGLTPLQFVETYLVGSGVSVSNALYNGSDEPLNSINRIPLKYRDQIGSFTDPGGAQAQLGIGGGVILSTGYTSKAIAGNYPDDNMWGTSPGESDPDLVILAGGSAINDKSVLEFDFVPQTDIMTFRYVFGSIEFDGFCSSINDAFGLFLSGPGISGGLGFANDAVNIALLPNSANYVNIFNICAADYGNLGLGIYSWWNLKKDYFSYNRLTYVFTASYTVQCNQSYHMKFAIGDASDGVLDSGVFLEQNSFSSNNVTSSASFSNPLTGQLLIEGCCNTSLIYSVPQAPTSDLIIDLAIHPSGTASQADILPNPFPVHAVILAGQLQTTPILIIPVQDAMPEPMENLVIKGSTLICNISASITNEFFIKDYNPLTVDMSNVTICDGASVTLTPSVSGGQPVLPDNNYIYLWSTGDTTTSIAVTPPFGHHLYSVTVTDACSQLAIREISVDVGTTPVPAGPISGTDTICTPANGLTYEIPVITGADSYIWILPSGSTITAGNNTNSITVDFNETTASGLISVHGHSNFCGDGMSSNLNLFINPSAPAAGAITGPLNPVCQGTTAYTYSIEPLNFISSYEWTVPTGVTILSGANTNQITCTFGTTAVSGDIKVRGFNSDCGFGQQSVKPVIVNPLPGAAGIIGSINGNTFCKPQTGAMFEVSSIPNASNYLWIYTGLTGQVTNNGAQFFIDFTASSSSGVLYRTWRSGTISGRFYIQSCRQRRYRRKRYSWSRTYCRLPIYQYLQLFRRENFYHIGFQFKRQ
ncbi:MAG: choice-of-anchor L domain-containing protein [Bacteroidetes bacterium]|nr:choice-of-anchor L domain-containing protein [Bacteroidota bacterium]